MAREYRNGFGVAYRELEKTSEELEALFQLGQIRLSHEEINGGAMPSRLSKAI